MKHFDQPPKLDEKEAVATPDARERIESPFEDFKETEEGVITGLAKKMGKRVTPLIASLSLFAGASSVYAGENPADIAMVDRSEETKEEVLAPREPESERLFNKISLTLGGTIEKTPSLPKGFQPTYYLTGPEMDYTIGQNWLSIENASSAKEYFNNLASLKLSSQQKVFMLRVIGGNLYQNYNFDMVAKNETVNVSDDAMFQSLKAALNKEKLPGGMCGNVSTFVAKAARMMGMESWLQDTLSHGSGHIMTGVVADDGKNKEIVFLDGGDSFRTGTLNFNDAIGMRERIVGMAAPLQTFVADEKNVLFPVKSRAQEITSAFAGIQHTQEELESALGAGALKLKTNGIELALSPDVHTLSLNRSHIGVEVLNFSDIRNNPYQSLKSANALKVSGRFGNERASIDADATIMRLSVKNFENGTADFNEVVGRVFANYLDELHLTKGEYGELRARLGATLQTAFSMPTTDVFTTFDNKDLSTEGAMGARLIYIDPHEVGQFHVGASQLLRGQFTDFQTQKYVPHIASIEFSLGAKVKAHEGLIMGLDASHALHDWGKATEVKAGVKTKLGAAEAGYKKEKSDYERFVPSTETISGSVSYTDNPKFEVRIFGFKKKEQYKDAKPHDEYEGQVQFILKFY